MPPRPMTVDLESLSRRRPGRHAGVVSRPAALDESLTSVGSALNHRRHAAGFFAGVVDEVRIWNSARSQAQIQAAKDTQITSGHRAGLLGVLESQRGHRHAASPTAPATPSRAPLWPAPPGSPASIRRHRRRQLLPSSSTARTSTRRSAPRPAPFGHLHRRALVQADRRGRRHEHRHGGHRERDPADHQGPWRGRGSTPTSTTSWVSTRPPAGSSPTSRKRTGGHHARAQPSDHRHGRRHADNVWHHAAATYDGRPGTCTSTVSWTARWRQPAGHRARPTSLHVGRVCADHRRRRRRLLRRRHRRGADLERRAQPGPDPGREGHRDHERPEPVCSASGTSTRAPAPPSPTAPATASRAPLWPARPGSPASCRRAARQHGTDRADARRAGRRGATGVSDVADADVGVSDPDGGALTVTFFGRAVRQRQFTQIAHAHRRRLGRQRHAHVVEPRRRPDLRVVRHRQRRHASRRPARPGPSTPSPSADPVFVGAGDIADCERTQDEATAAVIGGVDGTVWTAGDNVYPTGTLANFTNCYEPSWGGAIKARTRPCPATTTGAPAALDEPRRLLRLLRRAARPTAVARATTATTSRQQLARRQPRQRVPARGRRLRGRLAAGDLARRPTSPPTATKNVIAVWHKPRFSSGVTNYHGAPAAVGRPVRGRRRHPARRATTTSTSGSRR